MTSSGRVWKMDEESETTGDCKFAEHCGGGHTTAQHHIHVYERIIKQECGLKAYYAIEEAVNLAATVQKMDKS